ncbi:multidrug resistance-associated protein 1-like [Bradysia coprophila]|uniref:multidrug resistance-associated protein 1-like n=1 Tax=Bradysia coprophila TaxID=38358 RepID=UPI00187D8B86|nr:multidrug resistance-associated protein 1-like [Bradysia coprophila]
MFGFCGSQLWDSNTTWHTIDPHFTQCFELTILVWAPCLLLFVLAPLDIYYIRCSKYGNIPWGFINIARLVIPSLLICLCIVDLSIAAAYRSEYSLQNVYMVSPAVKIVTFLLAIYLAYLHKANGIVSSGSLFLFWLTLVVCAIPQYRSEIVQFQQRTPTFGSEKISWHDYQFLSYMFYFPLVTVQLLVNCFSDKKPSKSAYAEQRQPNPEIEASFLRKLFFIWFDSFAWMGYRTPLTTDHMWDIRPEDTTRELVPGFEKHWQESVESGKRKAHSKAKPSKDDSNNKTTNGSILPAMFKTFGGTFYFAGFLKLALDVLAFASPQLLSLLINFTGDFDAPLWHGILFAVGLFLVSVGSSLINGQFLYKSFLVGFRIRSALISAIYKKALTVSNSAKKDTTVGEIVNLMIIDAQRFFELIQYLHIIWAGPLTIALSLYFLYQILGVAVFSGLIVMILMFPLNAYIATMLRNYQIVQMKRKDERVKMMNETLSGIKVLNKIIEKFVWNIL